MYIIKKIDLVQEVWEQVEVEVEVEGVGCITILHSPDLYYKLQVSYSLNLIVVFLLFGI
jgi:hypothetical protein